MEGLFRIFFEKLIAGILILIATGLILAWTINIQKRAEESKYRGLISLVKLNQQLFERK